MINLKKHSMMYKEILKKVLRSNHIFLNIELVKEINKNLAPRYRISVEQLYYVLILQRKYKIFRYKPLGKVEYLFVER